MEHLHTTGSALTDQCKVENSKVKVEQSLVELEKSWDGLLKSVDNKEKQILTRKSNLDQFTVTLTKVSHQLDTMQQQVNKPVDWSAGDKMIDEAEVMIDCG